MAGRVDFGLIDLGGRIVLIQDESKYPTRFWKMPGGKAEGDESPQETVVREIQEKTGLLLESESDLLFYSELVNEGELEREHLFDVWLMMSENVNESEIQPDSEVRAIQAFSLDEVKRLFGKREILPGHDRLIDMYLYHLEKTEAASETLTPLQGGLHVRTR